MFKLTRRGFLAAGTLMMLARPLRAAPKPVTLIVPYAAGGPNDNFARLLAEGMSAQLGVPFIVENKPGAKLWGDKIIPAIRKEVGSTTAVV